MFSRISTIAFCALFAFAMLASATPADVKRWATTTTPPVTTTVTVTAPATTVTIPASQCSTGPVQCCNSTETAGSGLGSLLLGLLGIVVQDLDLLLGVSCSPIDVLGGGTCTSQAVCCEDNAVGGLISIGCIVVTL